MATPITVYANDSDLQVAINPAALVGVSSAMKTRACADASAEMDGYFRDKFTLPFVQVGQDVRRKCADIALFYIMRGKGFNPEADPMVEAGYDKAIAWLKEVTKGHVTPDVTDSSLVAVRGEPSDEPLVVSGSQRGWSARGETVRSPFQSD